GGRATSRSACRRSRSGRRSKAAGCGGVARPERPSTHWLKASPRGMIQRRNNRQERHMLARKMIVGLAFGAPLLALASTAGAQQGSDAAYMKKVATAAPAQITCGATVGRMVSGQMQTLKKG